MSEAELMSVTVDTPDTPRVASVRLDGEEIKLKDSKLARQEDEEDAEAKAMVTFTRKILRKFPALFFQCGKALVMEILCGILFY
jgi:hypothetical protein